MQDNKWALMLAYVTALADQRLLLHCEYLVTENRIPRSHLPARIRLSARERSTLAEIGKRLGRKHRAEVASVANPDTILAWYRRLISRKFDSDGGARVSMLPLKLSSSAWRRRTPAGVMIGLPARWLTLPPRLRPDGRGYPQAPLPSEKLPARQTAFRQNAATLCPL